MKFDKKAFLPHVIAFVVFLVLSAIYFSPALEGYSLRMGDIISHRGMAKELMDYRMLEGKEQLWTNSMFGGMPTYQITFRTYSNFFGLIFFLGKIIPQPIFVFFLMMVSFYVLAISLRIKPYVAMIGSVAFSFSTFFMVSTEAGHSTKVLAISIMPLIFAGVIRIMRWQYWVGGIIFTLGITLQLVANHVQITYYTMILSIIYIGYFIIQDVKAKKIPELTRAAITFVVGIVLALGMNTTKLYMTYEYAKSTIRGKSELTKNSNGSSNAKNKSAGLDRDYITAWSLGIGETWSLIIPNAKGGATGRLKDQNPDALKGVSGNFKQIIGGQDAYWGNQPFTAGPVYIGAALFLLFVLGMVTLKNQMKWPLLVTVGLVVLLSWGKNFMWFTDLFIDYFPMYNKFRTVTMTLVLLMLIAPVVAIMFINKLTSDDDFFEENKKKILITSGSVIGAILVLVMMPETFFDFLKVAESDYFSNQQQSNPGAAGQISLIMNELTSTRVGVFRKDALRTILILVITVGLIYAYAFRKIKDQVLIYALFAVVVMDLWTVNKRYLNNDEARGKYVKWIKSEELNKPYRAETYDIQILNAEKNNISDYAQQVSNWQSDLKAEKGKLSPVDNEGIEFGVLNANSNYRVLNLAENTFNSSRTSYFHKSVGGYHAAKLMRYQELIEHYINRSNNNISTDVLNMLNTKYIVTPDQGGKLQQNPNAYGNAWFVDQIVEVQNADEEIAALGENNLSKTAIIDKRFTADLSGFSPSKDNNSSIQLTYYSPSKLTYQSNASSDQYAVFSEIYYQPGWNAYIDGELIDHDRVNYVLRGMKIPAGNHEIEFRMAPQSYKIGEWIAYTCSSLLVLLILFAVYKHNKEGMIEA